MAQIIFKLKIFLKPSIASLDIISICYALVLFSLPFCKPCLYVESCAYNSYCKPFLHLLCYYSRDTSILISLGLVPEDVKGYCAYNAQKQWAESSHYCGIAYVLRLL